MKYIIISIFLFLLITIPYVYYQDFKCSERGGVATRIGCVKTEIFLND